MTPGAPAPIRVLLVDDPPLFREGMRVIIDAQDGLEVVGGAGDGFEAVDLVDALEPDVVLMDIRMPELDGVEATRRIFLPDRVLARARPVRVLVLTTFDLDDRAAAAIRHGASGFLLKDTTPALLIDAIRTVHGGNAVLAPESLTALLTGSFTEATEPPAAYTSLTEPPAAYTSLTEKEREVFGASNAEVAAALFTSESTVKTHVGPVLRKLGLRDRVQLVVFAYEHGLA